jgi:hypothetical protein
MPANFYGSLGEGVPDYGVCEMGGNSSALVGFDGFNSQLIAALVMKFGEAPSDELVIFRHWKSSD